MPFPWEVKSYEDLKNDEWLLKTEQKLKKLIDEIEELKDKNSKNDKIDWILETDKNSEQKELNKGLKNALISADNSVLEALINELSKFVDKEWVNELLVVLKGILWEKLWKSWYSWDNPSVDVGETSKASDNLKKNNLLKFYRDSKIDRRTSHRKKWRSLSSLISKKDFKKRDEGDANKLLDKYTISWSERNVSQFNAYIDRAKDRLQNHATLSKQDFISYFWWSSTILMFQDAFKKEKYWQWNVWNCYFVAALRSIIQSPLYEHFIRTSVSYNKEKKEFSIRIPLWNTKAKEYIISEDLLKPQKNRFYVEGKIIPPQTKPLQQVRRNRKKRKYEAVFDDKWNPVFFNKNREYLKPINAPKWIQALETAFLAATSADENWKVDRLKMEWWIWSEALGTLLWENNTDSQLFTIKGHQKETEKLFDNFHPLTHYTVLWSIPSSRGHNKFYKVKWSNVRLAHSHAYSVIWTDPVKKTVTLVNPWEFTKPFTLTYQQTIENFYTVMGSKVDYRNWFT